MDHSFTLRPRNRAVPLLLALVGCVGAGPATQVQPIERCVPAEAFLRDVIGLETITEIDTVDDWRTQRILPGCRVTAAGMTATDLELEAEALYQRLQAAGWQRTPDPRDAPAEAALRYRMGETDCFFQIYRGILLGTASELEVSGRIDRRDDERLWNVLVQCVEAMEAAPR